MDNKPEQKSSSPVQKASKRSGGWKRFFGKKWVFPGIYMLAAALILALMWWYQDSRMSVDPNETGMSEEQQQDISLGQNDEAVQTGAEAEEMALPVGGEVDITMNFYDENASQEEKEAALVEYGQSFNPHTGIDFAREDGESFDVLAALSGTVSSVDTHPLNGQEVRVQHTDGLETVYQSLEEVQVKEGDTVTQGDVIGTAGRSKVEKESGVHLHFEVHQDGEPVNPVNHLPQVE
ncbi:M23 family metallopeptidase [Novibacillus thermophilus]|uniref:M23ase beta-sheet core domain-containing protein n=1 Tax=Novibacillus thermophilus TaxID=1471761 RepID=A0A1U9KAW1_9BACL|nr:M23 family metallopeptidase [Novibacillus thermophilus]AQS57178.1 hypothetical protein B0W44_16915 [Novibacillus thermophilus]